MTSNQINYFKAREEQRSNYAKEDISRAQLAIDQQNANTNAANAATNARNAATREAELAETREYHQQSLANQSTRNANDYSTAMYNADISKSAKEASIEEEKRHNLAVESEAKRHNVAEEDVKVAGLFTNSISDVIRVAGMFAGVR